jgi:hypothetical protein
MRIPGLVYTVISSLDLWIIDVFYASPLPLASASCYLVTLGVRSLLDMYVLLPAQMYFMQKVLNALP